MILRPIQQSISGRTAWSSGFVGLVVGLMVFWVGILPRTATGQIETVEEAGLIDLSFQRDMQYAMGQILAQIHGSHTADPSIGFSVDQEQVSVITSLANDQLLAQNENQQADSSLGQSGFSDSESTNVDDDVVTLNFQGADINALINLVSQVTGKSFIVDPRVRGKVTLVSGGGLPVDHLYDIFLSVLEVSNFAAVDSGTVTKILPKNLIKQHPAPTSEFGSPADTDEHFTHIVTLEHASVS